MLTEERRELLPYVPSGLAVLDQPVAERPPLVLYLDGKDLRLLASHSASNGWQVRLLEQQYGPHVLPGHSGISM